jgi:hypothetical protein
MQMFFTIFLKKNLSSFNITKQKNYASDFPIFYKIKNRKIILSATKDYLDLSERSEGLPWFV